MERQVCALPKIKKKIKFLDRLLRSKQSQYIIPLLMAPQKEERASHTKISFLSNKPM